MSASGQARSGHLRRPTGQRLLVLDPNAPEFLTSFRQILAKNGIVRLKTKDPEHRTIDLKIQKQALRYIADQIEN
jgi:Trm5-related predicted tRNA methylase